MIKIFKRALNKKPIEKIKITDRKLSFVKIAVYLCLRPSINKNISIMNNTFIFILLALITGALIPVQASTNAAFSKSIGNPYITGVVVLLIGLIAALLFITLSKTQVPALAQLKSAPLYSYAGGLIVCTYVIMITVITPKLGVANSIGLIVTGQIICAVIIDHFGLFGATVRMIDAQRLIGAVMMIGGIYLVMKKHTP
jgi:bacterial/archaeal transporter family-2 protein